LPDSPCGRASISASNQQPWAANPHKFQEVLSGRAIILVTDVDISQTLHFALPLAVRSEHFSCHGGHYECLRQSRQKRATTYATNTHGRFEPSINERIFNRRKFPQGSTNDDYCHK
jgi:hypothetical protein